MRPEYTFTSQVYEGRQTYVYLITVSMLSSYVTETGIYSRLQNPAVGVHTFPYSLSLQVSATQPTLQLSWNFPTNQTQVQHFNNDKPLIQGTPSKQALFVVGRTQFLSALPHSSIRDHYQLEQQFLHRHHSSNVSRT